MTGRIVGDAMFAAFALNRGIRVVLSADTDLEGIEGLRRIDPAAVEELRA